MIRNYYVMRNIKVVEEGTEVDNNGVSSALYFPIIYDYNDPMKRKETAGIQKKL